MLAIVTALTAMLVIERFTFAVVCLVFHLFGQGSDRKSVWFVTSVMQGLISFVTGLLSAISRFFTLSVRGAMWCVLVMVVWGVLYCVAQNSTEALLTVQRVYNTDIAGLFRSALVIPMQFSLLIFDALVPIYNMLMYVIKTVPVRIFTENMLTDLADITACMMEIVLFAKSMLESLFSWISVLVNPPDSFDASLRVLDLMTPLAHVRLAVSYALVWSGKMCSMATSILDIVCYPLMDINFGESVHNLGNAVLFLVVHVPALTVERCKVGVSTVYCLPDFYPVFDLLTMGIGHLGLLLDNWLDVTLLIIQAALTNTRPACTGWTVVDFHTGGGGIMGLNETRVIGIDANHFAKTDGIHVELYSRTSMEVFQDKFPFPVRLDYGIARVSASVETPGILGCKCTDESWGMQIVCAVAPLSSVQESVLVPVEFRIPTTSFYMGCDRSKIKVESIRWPVDRMTSNKKASAPLLAQAAVWVRPFCSSESIDIVCIETFTLAGCFPYCMALYTKGYTGSMVMRDASEWTSTVAMMNRDCGLHTWDVTSGLLVDVTAKLRQNSGVSNIFMEGEVQLNSSRCVYSGSTLSRMQRTVVPGYDVHRSVDLSSQPFAFAGDLVLTAVQYSTETWGIDVSRIWGNQANEFTIIPVNKFIPALPPCKTPSDCTSVEQSCARGWCKVAVPYSFDSTHWAHIPAVSTERYVFWITNPSLAMYYSVNQLCVGGQGSLSFIAESSYHSIQIWRFDPYEYCPMVNGVVQCAPDTTATYRKLPGFVSGDLDESVCHQVFNVVAPSMTYINEDNIAITVLEAAFENIDVDTLRPRDPTQSRSVVYLEVAVQLREQVLQLHRLLRDQHVGLAPVCELVDADALLLIRQKRRKVARHAREVEHHRHHHRHDRRPVFVYELAAVGPDVCLQDRVVQLQAGEHHQRRHVHVVPVPLAQGQP